jgi:hypothetical protein
MGYLLAAATAPQVTNRAEAHIDFGVDCSGGRPCVLVPILRAEQLLVPLTVPVPFPPGPCDNCPPFIEIFDIPSLDIANFQAPPAFQAQMRLFGDPSPQPNITDSPNIPNLLLIFTGPNEIAGPAVLGSFELPLPQQITELDYYAHAFDMQRMPVSNVGTIRIPEPTSVVLLILGVGLTCYAFTRRRRHLKGSSQCRF